jgi:hypothetical protein
MLPELVFRGVEDDLDVLVERVDPIGIASIDAAWQFQEGADEALVFAFDLDEFHRYELKAAKLRRFERCAEFWGAA